MDKPSTKYFKTILLVAMVYVAIQFFHKFQRQKYLEIAEKTLTVLAIEEEFYFSRHFNYTANLTDLDIEIPGSLSIDISATSDGWTGVAKHKHLSSENGCVIYFGTSEIPSLGETKPRFAGDVACTP